MKRTISSMRYFPALLITSALALPACSGGGSSAAAPAGPTTVTTSATTAPTTAPTTTPASVLQEAMLSGSQAFVATSGRTVYVFDADLGHNNSSTCTVASGCTAAWPPVSPPSSASVVSPWAMFNRTDGSMGPQLTFEGRALYTFAGDTSNGTTAGEGINAFGGVWHVARPTQSVTSTAPTLPGY